MLEILHPPPKKGIALQIKIFKYLQFIPLISHMNLRSAKSIHNPFHCFQSVPIFTVQSKNASSLKLPIMQSCPDGSSRYARKSPLYGNTPAFKRYRKTNIFA